eukprot:sb/3470253/
MASSQFTEEMQASIDQMEDLLEGLGDVDELVGLGEEDEDPSVEDEEITSGQKQSRDSVTKQPKQKDSAAKQPKQKDSVTKQPDLPREQAFQMIRHTGGDTAAAFPTDAPDDPLPGPPDDPPPQDNNNNPEREEEDDNNPEGDKEGEGGDPEEGDKEGDGEGVSAQQLEALLKDHADVLSRLDNILNPTGQVKYDYNPCSQPSLRAGQVN